MLNFKLVQVIQRGQQHIGIQIEWSAVSKSDQNYDGLEKYDYDTDVVFAIHAIPCESEYHVVLMELFKHFNAQISLFHITGEGLDCLVQDISSWMLTKGFHLI